MTKGKRTSGGDERARIPESTDRETRARRRRRVVATVSVSAVPSVRRDAFAFAKLPLPKCLFLFTLGGRPRLRLERAPLPHGPTLTAVFPRTYSLGRYPHTCPSLLAPRLSPRTRTTPRGTVVGARSYRPGLHVEPHTAVSASLGSVRFRSRASSSSLVTTPTGVPVGYGRSRRPFRISAPSTISIRSPSTATILLTKKSPRPGATPAARVAASTKAGGGANRTTSPTVADSRAPERRSTSMTSPFRMPGAMDSLGTAASDATSPLRSVPAHSQNADADAATRALHPSSARTVRSSAKTTPTSTEPQGVHVGFESSATSSQSEDAFSSSASTEFLRVGGTFAPFAPFGGGGSVAQRAGARRRRSARSKSASNTSAGFRTSRPPRRRQNRSLTSYLCPAYSPSGLHVHPAMATPPTRMSSDVSRRSRADVAAPDAYRSTAFTASDSHRPTPTLFAAVVALNAPGSWSQMSLAKGGGGEEGEEDEEAAAASAAASARRSSGGTATLAPLRTPGASRRIGRTFPANALVEAYSSADHPNRFRAVASAPGAPRSRRTVASRPYWDAHMSAVLPLASRWFTSSEARRRSTAATSPRRAARCSSGLARVVPEPNMSGEGGGGGRRRRTPTPSASSIATVRAPRPTAGVRARARLGRAPARGDPRRHGRANDPRHAARDATRDATRGARESDGASREHLRALFVVAGTWRHNHAASAASRPWFRESHTDGSRESRSVRGRVGE